MNAPEPVRRHALIIGVDRYPNLEARYQLRGCVNDAHALASVLSERHGFRADDIVLLLDEQATRDAVLAALEALLAGVAQDDQVFVHFSGHGSRRERADQAESSGYDSTIMPHDSGRSPSPNLDIRDDDIGAWLDRLAARTSFATVVFDCCHSGTLSRDAFAALVRAGPADVTEAPHSDARRAIAYAQRATEHVVISACHDHEEAHESRQADDSSPPHGALSRHLARALADAAAGDTWRDVFERVALDVRLEYADQHPRVRGNVDRELFGARSSAPASSVLVTDIGDDLVELSVGAVHGATVGSRWSLHAENAKLGDETVLGEVEVRRVGGVVSRARVLASSEPPRIGMRAEEQLHVRPALRSTVALVVPAGEHTAAVEALREAVEGSALLRLAASDEQASAADFLVRLLEPQSAAADRAAFAQLPVPLHPSWLLLDRQGKLAAPVHGIDEPGVAALLRDNLEKRTRVRNLLALSNTDRRSSLRGMLGMRLYRRRTGGEWVEATAGADGEAHFDGGDGLGLRITNRSALPLFVVVLNVDAEGAISPLYPRDQANALLAANAGVTVGLPGDGYAMTIAALAGDYAGDGRETIKVFAATGEIDLSRLTQSGVRAGPPSDELTALLAFAWHGPGATPVNATRGTGGDWTTTTRTFVVDPPRR